MEKNLDKRRQELSRLKAYADDVEKEVTSLLQELQWDPKLMTEKCPMVNCKYDSNHRIPLANRDTHEKQCHLTKLGYKKDDIYLPDPVDPDANTLVKFSKPEIAEILQNAAINNPLFKKGCQGPEPPLTVERLQLTYTADERRAIYDAVVNAAPFCHDLADLELLSSNDDTKESQKKSRMEILAELRNMKRRRTKYRVAPKTRNYSDVLRDVIKTQMDSYGEATRTIIKTEYGQNFYTSQKVSNISSRNDLPNNVVIKLERKSPEPHSYNKSREGPRERYRARSREKRYNDDRRAYRKDIFSYKGSDGSYTESLQSAISRGSTERNRERRHDDNEKHSNDKIYSSKEKITNYDKRDDYRSGYSDHSSRDRNRHYKTNNSDVIQRDIKQERVSQESESYTNSNKDRNHDRSRSRDKRHNSKRKRSKERRHSPYKEIKKERSYDFTSRKRQRSKSRDESKKRRHDRERH